MQYLPPALEKLVEQFNRLPGIGAKSAQRLAFYVLDLPPEEAESFAQAILEAKRAITCCPVCQNLTEGEGPCALCSSFKRDHSLVCVVADPKDVIAMERSGEYNGVYHVLHGVLSPMNHVGPDDLRIRQLVERVTTAMYISRLLRPFDIKITRLAYGIPVGSHLEYADDATLARALEGRREM